jgi:hypothetical protein
MPVASHCGTMSNTSKLKRLGAGAALLALATAFSGCYAEATTGGVVEAEYAPARVDMYPQEYYDGHVVYLVGDRWYYHDGPHWVYYRREPEVLYRHRVVVRQAPVAHRAVVRERTVVHQAPASRHYYRAAPAGRRAERHEAPRAY